MEDTWDQAEEDTQHSEHEAVLTKLAPCKSRRKCVPHDRCGGRQEPQRPQHEASLTRKIRRNRQQPYLTDHGADRSFGEVQPWNSDCGFPDRLPMCAGCRAPPHHFRTHGSIANCTRINVCLHPAQSPLIGNSADRNFGEGHDILFKRDGREE